MSRMFGEIYAPIYDFVYEDKAYDAEANLVERIFRDYATKPVTKLLDLGCGTGNHAIRLAARGYEVLGIDRSAEMLKVASEKGRAQSQNIRFHQEDIRALNTPEVFDAALMMFAVLGYQFEDIDILDTLRTARRHLGADGLLVFDVWYGPAVLAQGTQGRTRTIRLPGKTWVRTSSGTLETKRNLCHVEFIIQQFEDNVAVSKVSENHTLRYFFPKEIEEFLAKAGLRLLRLGAFPDFDDQPSENTWNVMVVAVAI